MSPMLRSGLVIDAVSLAGSEHVNQDVWGYRDETVWVVDGATAPSTQDGASVVEYITDLSTALDDAAENVTDSLERVLESALQQIQYRPAAQAGFSATVALARRTDNGWEWLVLGDAAVVVEDPVPGNRLISDLRLSHVAKELRLEREELQRRGDTTDRYHEIDLDLKRQESLFRNQKDGFWVAASDPSAAEHALRGSSPDATGIYLMSDGVVDGLENLHWASVDEAVTQWNASGAHQSVSSMREALLASRRSVDDATLVCLRDDA